MTVHNDIAEYVVAARRHGAATIVGDATTANTAFDELDGCWKRLRMSPENWQSAFLELLEDEDPWVRLWAASHGLHLDAERSIGVLEALTAEPVFLGFNARMTLDAWRKGELGERI